jgi:hypothetical protein
LRLEVLLVRSYCHLRGVDPGGRASDHLLLKVGEKLNEVAVVVPKGSYPKGGC